MIIYYPSALTMTSCTIAAYSSPISNLATTAFSSSSCTISTPFGTSSYTGGTTISINLAAGTNPSSV